MRGEPRNPERADLPIDWMAEFTDEEVQDAREVHDAREGQAASGERVEPSRLIDLPLQASEASGHGVQEPRLIPLPSSETPMSRWSPPPRTRRHERSLSVPEMAVVSIAMIAIIAGLLAAATLWNRTTQTVDPAAMLGRAPAPPPIESPALSVAPLAPPAPPDPSTLVSPTAVPTPRPTTKPEVGAKRPAPAKPPPSVAAAGGRASRGAPPRPTASPKPTPVQAAIDRQRPALAAGAATGVTSTPTPTSTPTSTATPPPAPPPPVMTPTSTVIVGPPGATLGTPPPAKPAIETGKPSPVPDERAIHTAAIRAVLDRYRLAFNTLSVDGLGTVWRSVDTKALARAFEQLEKQSVEFDACQIEINGELAEASCTGRTSFVPKIGARTPRVESRKWSFRLVHVRGGWIIDRVESR